MDVRERLQGNSYVGRNPRFKVYDERAVHRERAFHRSYRQILILLWADSIEIGRSREEIPCESMKNRIGYCGPFHTAKSREYNRHGRDSPRAHSREFHVYKRIRTRVYAE